MPTLRCLAILPALAAATPSALAQDHLAWKQGLVAAGPRANEGLSTAARWDPDGPGPRGEVFVVGGNFAIPSLGARHLAWFDPATAVWGAFAAQPNDAVLAVVVRADGSLAIGGRFTAIGTQPALRIAIGDGDTWMSPGGGCAGSGYAAVQALQPLPNGDLVVGGQFAQAGSIAAGGIARWDGGQWHSFGGANIQVACMALRGNGHLVVGGNFPTSVAEWDGQGWTTLAPGFGGVPIAIAVMPNGDVVASGGAYGMNRWNGSVWSPLGSGFQGAPAALLPQPNGELLAATMQTLGGVPHNGVARWNGSQWTSYAPGIGSVASMTLLPNGELLAAGALTTGTSEITRGLAIWNGASWRGLARGFDDTVEGLLPMTNGDLLAFGAFQVAAGAAIPGFARRAGGAWYPMTPAAGSSTYPTKPTCGAIDAVGDVWVAVPATVTPAPATVLRWTGLGWQGVGTAIAAVKALALDDNQRPIVGCAVYPGYGQAIARWNGTAWANLGQGLDGPVLALRWQPNGDVIAGGEFLASGTTAVSRIARWNGTAWQPLGAGFDGPVRALCELPGGDLIAAGDFRHDGTLARPLDLIARWDGTAWQPLGEGLGGAPGVAVRALHVLPNGDLLAGGDFTTAGGRAIRGIARWNGTAWSSVDGDVDGNVRAIARLPDGEIVIGGDFATAGGHPSAHFARLLTDRKALATPRGDGCAGSAGPLVLEAGELPWLGATYRATCYGVSSSAIALDVLGLQPTALPLSGLHPAAGANCQLLTTLDVVTLRLPASGTIASTVGIPPAANLLGLQFHQQIVVGELDPGLAITHVASSNALALAFGAL